MSEPETINKTKCSQALRLDTEQAHYKLKKNYKTPLIILQRKWKMQKEIYLDQRARNSKLAAAQESSRDSF